MYSTGRNTQTSDFTGGGRVRGGAFASTGASTHGVKSDTAGQGRKYAHPLIQASDIIAGCISSLCVIVRMCVPSTCSCKCLYTCTL